VSGTEDKSACALIILEKGELEVSDKERAQRYEALFKVRGRRAHPLASPRQSPAYHAWPLRTLRALSPRAV